MALVLADRVKETTTTTGTGTVTLLGASAGYQSFTAIGNGNTTYYTISGQTTSEWEVGIGTYTSSGTTLSRTTVLSSSNGGSLVNFSAGTKDVFVTYPSGRSVNADAANTVVSVPQLSATSITNTGLTSGRVVYSTTGGLETDSANLTFNGTTLTANTIGAFTLSGTIAGGGNQINNVIIGTSTPLAGAFTTLSATNNVTIYDATVNTPRVLTFSANRTSAGNYGSIIFGNTQNLNNNASIVGSVDANIDDGKLTFSTAPTGGSITERARIDSSGNLGVGTTSPTKRLQVESGSTATGGQAWSHSSGTVYARIGVVNPGTDNNTAFGAVSNNALVLLSNNTERVRINESGNLGIGTTSPTTLLTVSGAGSTGLLTVNRTDGSGFMSLNSANGVAGAQISSTGGQGLQVYTNMATSAVLAMTLDSSGNLLVGTTATSVTGSTGFRYLGGGRIAVTDAASTNATTTYEAYSTGAGAFRFYVGYGGTIFATSIVISAISDQRLKQNIRNIDTGLDSIMALKPRRFDWKEGKGQDKKNVAGFIAQEFEEVFPECVSTSKAGEDGIEYKNINHETLIPTLVKAIQEQQALITQLTARITALETT